MTRLATSWAEFMRADPIAARLRNGLRRAAMKGLRLRRTAAEPGVRIVHYHYVFDDQRESFARQLEYLASRFEPVSLTEAVRRIRTGEVLGRELAITFDDGFRNQLTNAGPALAEAGFSACLFLIAQLVGAPADAAERICRERILMPCAVEPLHPEDLAELLALGHELGSHTLTHPNLTEVNPAELLHEVAGSRAALERSLSRQVAHFSAPFGDRERFDVSVSRAAEAAGYESCSTAIRGVNRAGEDVFALRRHHLIASWPIGDLRYFLGEA